MATVRAAGISWFRREDYARMLTVMEDAHIFPRSYEAWQEKAERQERDAKKTGLVVTRVVIDLDEFAAWCKRNGMKLNAKARITFAGQVADGGVANTH